MNPEDVRRRWEDRSGEFSPEYYAHRGPDRTSEWISELCGRFVDRDAPVLELGCSSGRHLAHLHEAGFSDLTGIELNGNALSVMEDVYPDLAASGTFHVGAIEDTLGEFGDGAFGAVYSVETLQHVHPESEAVFAEIARITDSLLVTVENESEVGSTAENGGDESEPNGIEAVESNGTGPTVNYVDEGVPLYYRNWRQVFTDLGCLEIEAQSGRRDTLRAFRPPRV